MLCVACILAATVLGVGAWWLAGSLMALVVSVGLVGLYLSNLRCVEEGCHPSKSVLEEGSKIALVMAGSLLLFVLIDGTVARSTGSDTGGSFLREMIGGIETQSPPSETDGAVTSGYLGIQTEGPPMQDSPVSSIETPVPNQDTSVYSPDELRKMTNDFSKAAAPDEETLNLIEAMKRGETPSMSPPPTGEAEKGLSTVWLDIQGMTCGGCEAEIEYSTGKQRGVAFVDANYRDKSGIVKYDSGVISAEEIAAYITERIGYPSQVERTEILASTGEYEDVEETKVTGMRQVTIEVVGMCCGGCAVGLTRLWDQTPGVISAEVSFRQRTGIVEYDPSVIDPEGLIQVIARRTGKYRMKVLEDVPL